MFDSDQEQTNRSKNYIKENDFNQDYDEEREGGGRGVKDIFENEISEPEIMLFCKGDQQSTEILQKFSNLAKEQKYDSLIISINGLQLEEGSDKELKCHFVKNFYLGVAYFKKSRFEEALKHFLEANKIYQFYQLHYNIGLCYMKTNNLESAVYYFDTVTKLNKNNIFAFYNLIKIFLRQKNYNDAYLLYHEFMEVMKKENPQDKLIQQLEGNNERISGSPINYLKIFFKIGAECCFAKALYQECIHTILEGLKFNPEDPDLWCLYGKIFIVKKIYSFAKPLLVKALEFDPDHRESKELLEIISRVDIE